MPYGLVVDLTCDLPPEFRAETGSILLPITVRLDGAELVDDGEAAVTARCSPKTAARAGTLPKPNSMGADEIRSLFLGRLVVDYDARTLVRRRKRPQI